MVNVRELLEAEQLIQEIDEDHYHPAINIKHLNHNRAASAFKLLKAKAAAARTKIESERYFHK